MFPLLRCVFPLPHNNYGNQPQNLSQLEGRKKKKTYYFLTADVHMWLLAVWRQFVFPVNGEPLIFLQKKKKLLTNNAHKLTSAPSHHLPAACSADTVWAEGIILLFFHTNTIHLPTVWIVLAFLLIQTFHNTHYVAAELCGFQRLLLFGSFFIHDQNSPHLLPFSLNPYRWPLLCMGAFMREFKPTL